MLGALFCEEGVAKSHFAIVIGKNVHYARWATTVGLIYGSPRRCWRHKSVQKLLYFLALWLTSVKYCRPKYAEAEQSLVSFSSTCTFSWEIPKKLQMRFCSSIDDSRLSPPPKYPVWKQPKTVKAQKTQRKSWWFQAVIKQLLRYIGGIRVQFWTLKSHNQK